MVKALSRSAGPPALCHGDPGVGFIGEFEGGPVAISTIRRHMSIPLPLLRRSWSVRWSLTLCGGLAWVNTKVAAHACYLYRSAWRPVGRPPPEGAQADGSSSRTS